MSEALRCGKGYVSPVDLLIKLGYLSLESYENWRFGRVPYLEKVCKVNLSRLSFIIKKLRTYAASKNLEPRWTAYKKFGKGKKIILRFSKSGAEHIEKSYATHYVDVPRMKKLKKATNAAN